MSRGIPCTAALALFLSASHAYGQLGVGPGFSDTSTVNAYGRGEVLVPPTRASVLLEVVAEGVSAAGAAAAGDSIVAGVRSVLSALGVGSDDIGPWGFGVGESTQRGRAIPPGQPGAAVTVFEARSGIRVAVVPVGRLGEIVGAALAAGADRVAFVDYEADDTEAAEREAARIAVRRARTAAEAIAEAEGGSLGSVRHLTMTPDFQAESVFATRFLSGGFPNQGAQLILSEVRVAVQVQASWVFLPR